MPVAFENFRYQYELKGKPVFAPSDLGRRIGEDVKQRVEDVFAFDPFYYHLREGGHVAALHAHRPNTHFAKIDLSRFFYSVSRNRVVRALRDIGVERPEHYGKWSTVRNPYDEPRYTLPYGFVQSPILASLAMSRSGLGDLLRQLSEQVTVSVYVDDISMSSTSAPLLQQAYESLIGGVADAGFILNDVKSQPPVDVLTIFNCELAHDSTKVKDERVEEFFSLQRSAESVLGFERYVASVQKGNA
jgi:hypothetical protein